MSSTANTADVHLVPETIFFGVDHGFSAGSQVMAVGNQNAFVLIQGSHADLDERCICSATGHVVGHDLHNVAYLHAEQVQHAGMQSFGLEIDESALLAGVSRSQKLDDLFFQIVQALSEVLQGPGLGAHDGLV